MLLFILLTRTSVCCHVIDLQDLPQYLAALHFDRHSVQSIIDFILSVSRPHAHRQVYIRQGLVLILGLVLTGIEYLNTLSSPFVPLF